MTDQVLEGMPKEAKHVAVRNKSLVSYEAKIFWQVNLVVAYYLGVMLAAVWLFLDTWSSHFYALHILGLEDQVLVDPMLASMVFVISGGIIGSILYHIRVLFRFYLKSTSYNYRWLAKYFSAPWESAAMSLVVLAMIQGGFALLGGSPAAQNDATSRFTSFGIGSLVGFGMRDVVGWMGNLVRTMFVSNGSSQNGHSSD